MDMNPVQVGGPDAALVYKDAIVFSGHKFVGECSVLRSSHISTHPPLAFMVLFFAYAAIPLLWAVLPLTVINQK